MFLDYFNRLILKINIILMYLQVKNNFKNNF
jgi:hypothetical protein